MPATSAMTTTATPTPIPAVAPLLNEWCLDVLGCAVPELCTLVEVVLEEVLLALVTASLVWAARRSTGADAGLKDGRSLCCHATVTARSYAMTFRVPDGKSTRPGRDVVSSSWQSLLAGHSPSKPLDVGSGLGSYMASFQVYIRRTANG